MIPNELFTFEIESGHGSSLDQMFGQPRSLVRSRGEVDAERLEPLEVSDCRVVVELSVERPVHAVEQSLGLTSGELLGPPFLHLLQPSSKRWVSDDRPQCVLLKLASLEALELLRGEIVLWVQFAGQLEEHFAVQVPCGQHRGAFVGEQPEDVALGSPIFQEQLEGSIEGLERLFDFPLLHRLQAAVVLVAVSGWINNALKNFRLPALGSPTLIDIPWRSPTERSVRRVVEQVVE